MALAGRGWLVAVWALFAGQAPEQPRGEFLVQGGLAPERAPDGAEQLLRGRVL